MFEPLKSGNMDGGQGGIQRYLRGGIPDPTNRVLTCKTGNE